MDAILFGTVINLAKRNIGIVIRLFAMQLKL